MNIPRRIRSRTIGLILLLVSIVLVLAIPVSATHVEPVLYSAAEGNTGNAGNVTCTTTQGQTVGLGFTYGYKPQPEPPPTGDYDFPDALAYSIFISSDGTLFSWTSDLPIVAVIVKGSNASNVYFYPDGENNDEGLHAPVNNGGFAAISHIEFCYDTLVPNRLIVEKTAETAWTQEYTWEIIKDVTPAVEYAFIGETVSFDYTVNVSPTVTDSYTLQGIVTINNPTNEAVTFEISDFIDGSVAVTVNCPANSVAAGDTIECSYSVPVTGTDYDGLENVVTVTPVESQVLGDEASATIVWGDPEILGFPTVNVEDVPNYLEWDPQSYEVTLEDTNEYTQDYTCPTDRNLYVDGVFTVDLENTATIIETQQSDSETVTVNCYLPSVSKTAEGSYDETHEWEVIKTVDPTSQSAFAGETVDFDWTITVNETSVTNDNYSVSGVITIVNPNPAEELEVILTDILDSNPVSGIGLVPDANCVAINGGGVVVPAGGTSLCKYISIATWDSLADAPTQNDVSIRIQPNDDQVVQYIASPIVWTANVINGEGDVVLDDEQFPYVDEPIFDGWTDTYTREYTCSTNELDYTDGVDPDNTVTNLAELSVDDQVIDDSEAITEIDCYMPALSKTADGTYDETHTWDVEKTVDPPSQSAFIGETVTFDWTITVDEIVEASNFNVTGELTLVNPNPDSELVVSLADFLSDGSSISLTASIDCELELVDSVLWWTVPADSTGNCSYQSTAEWASLDDAPTTNTVQISLNGIIYEDIVDIDWQANVIGAGDPVLDDIQFPYDDQEVSDGWETTYEDSYTCSRDINDYVDGVMLDNMVDNTASLYIDDQLVDESTATTEIDCYAISVEKTAEASGEETFDWTIDKTVDPASHSGFEGDSFASLYEVSVERTGEAGEFVVNGVITVTNYNPDSDIEVAIADEGAVLECQGTLLVPAGSSADCAYSIPLDEPVDGTNTATATLNDIEFSGSADYSFDITATGDPEDITIDDTNIDGSPDWATAGETQNSWQYSGQFVCPADEGQYVDGVYEFEIPNTATIIETDESADASVTVTCYQLEVEKTAEADSSADYEWTVDKEICIDLEPRENSQFDYYSRYYGGNSYHDWYHGAVCNEWGDEVTYYHESGYQGSIEKAYRITVDAELTEGSYSVEGTITVTNPNPDVNAVINSVSDVISPDIAVDVECNVDFPYELVNGQPLVCTYSSDLPDGEDRVNTATVTRQVFDYPYNLDPVANGEQELTAEAAIVFDGNSDTTDFWVKGWDSHFPGDYVYINADQTPKVFEYAVSFYPHHYESHFGCGEHVFTNVATIVEGDSHRRVSDSADFIVVIECEETSTVGQITPKHDVCNNFMFDEPGSANDVEMSINRYGSTNPRWFSYYALVDAPPSQNGYITLTIEQDNGDSPLIQSAYGYLYSTNCRNLSYRNGVRIRVNRSAGTITIRFPTSLVDENGQIVVRGIFNTPARKYSQDGSYSYVFTTNGQAPAELNFGASD